MQLDEKYIRHERIKVGDERMKKVILKNKNQQTVEAVHTHTHTSIPLNKEKVGREEELLFVVSQKFCGTINFAQKQREDLIKINKKVKFCSPYEIRKI